MLGSALLSVTLPVTLAAPMLVAVAGPAESAPAVPSRLPADDAFQQDCLKAHNAYRAWHGVPPLRTSPKIAEVAQLWAQRLVETRSFEHSPPAEHRRRGVSPALDRWLEAVGDSQYGENMSSFGSAMPGRVGSCADAVKGWYGEISVYDHDAPDTIENARKAGHFSQVVWKSSTQLGCGRATVTDSGWLKTYIVCNYSPAGNRPGEFRSNVPRRGTAPFRGTEGSR
ncbi:CAP family protein [Nonomuraea pusilla]|uniref:Cysteine-rich secretory protein family protein n=1 Tax=Nonomuraea pusilla TaxID=46177 RepID=A0A1H7YAA7_9ACTN|nr:CAP family protein [Nonomuraea pusilla]SEM42257.1 Cysteine-rich secretory protein family protein [Nonomuraea pusilla]